jgi:ABC-2 type transport system permease protein
LLNRLIHAMQRLPKREISRILHDRSLMMVILFGGLVYPLLYGTFYWHKRERDVPIAVVDQSRSDLSRQFIRWLDAHPTMAVAFQPGDADQARDLVYSMKAQAIVYIPPDYETSYKSGQGSSITVHLDASRFLLANNLNIAINEVVAEQNRRARLELFEKAGYTSEQAEEQAEPLRADIRSLFNPLDSYGNFLTPALFALILMQTMIVALSESMAKEREQRTVLEWRDDARGSIARMLAGKGSIYLIFYSAYALLFFSVLFKVFHLDFRGSGSALAALTVVWLAAVISWTIFAASFFTRKMTALQVSILSSYPVFLLSGYSWPSFSMPTVLQWLSYGLPGTPYLQAVMRITQMGAGWTHIWGCLLHLFLLAGLGFGLACYRLNRLIRHERTINQSQQAF